MTRCSSAYPDCCVFAWQSHLSTPSHSQSFLPPRQRRTAGGRRAARLCACGGGGAAVTRRRLLAPQPKPWRDVVATLLQYLHTDSACCRDEPGALADRQAQVGAPPSPLLCLHMAKTPHHCFRLPRSGKRLAAALLVHVCVSIVIMRFRDLFLGLRKEGLQLAGGSSVDSPVPASAGF